MREYLNIFFSIIISCFNISSSFNFNLNPSFEFNIWNYRIEYTSNLQWGETVYLKDVVTKLEGAKLLEPNMLIDTSTIGQKKIKYYLKNNQNKIKEAYLNINVKDNYYPTIYINSQEITKGEKIDLLSKATCLDNHDKNVKCYIEGNYDIDKVGSYDLTLIGIDSSGNKNEQQFTLKVKEKKEKEYIYHYKKSDSYFDLGISLSDSQKVTDWKTLKDIGVAKVILRIGYSHNDDYQIILDKEFKENLKNAKMYGINVGILFESNAKTSIESAKQALWIVQMLKDENIDLPIVFKYKTEGMNKNITTNDLKELVDTFANILEKNNYEIVIWTDYSHIMSLSDEFGIMLSNKNRKFWNSIPWLEIVDHCPYIESHEKSKFDGIDGIVEEISINESCSNFNENQ